MFYFKFPLITIALIFLFAACSPTATKNVNSPDLSDAVVSNATSLQEARFPVLKISEHDNSDVYLQVLSIQVEVVGNIASTRYNMVFKNSVQKFK
jgi:hypothetical protein